jgi:hypothetical protein
MPALLRKPTIGRWSAMISTAARRTLGQIRPVAHDRHPVLALLLDGLHLVQLSAVTAD